MKYENLKEFYDPADDELNRAEIGKIRTPRLTLRHINKLRKMREQKKLELQDQKKIRQAMYGQPPEAQQQPFV